MTCHIHVKIVGCKFLQVFTSIFTLECCLKLMALSKEFFECGWNIFDLIIVSASLLDLIFELVDGLSVLRGLRLVTIPSSVGKSFLRRFFTATRAKVGAVMDHHEGAIEYYH